MSQVQVSRWGKGLGLRIPSDMAEGLGLRVGDTLEMRASMDGVLLARERPTRQRYRFADIADSFPSVDDHPWVDFGPPQGDEVW